MRHAPRVPHFSAAGHHARRRGGNAGRPGRCGCVVEIHRRGRRRPGRQVWVARRQGQGRHVVGGPDLIPPRVLWAGFPRVRVPAELRVGRTSEHNHRREEAPPRPRLALGGPVVAEGYKLPRAWHVQEHQRRARQVKKIDEPALRPRV